MTGMDQFDADVRALDEDAGKRKARATLATRLFVVAVLILGILVVSMQLYTTLSTKTLVKQNNDLTRSISTGQKEGAARGKQIVNTAEQIESCTTPGGVCYERAVANTQKAVDDISRIVVLAATCADAPKRQTETEIQSCIIMRLAADEDPTD